MDLIRIFKRQKSRKKDKNAECIDKEIPDKPCDLNLDKSEKNEKRKFLRKSLKKKKSFQSNSCDDILHQGSSLSSAMGNQLPTILDSCGTSKRWSYSPDHTETHSFYPSMLPRRHTVGLLKVESQRPSSYGGNKDISPNPPMSSFNVQPPDQGKLSTLNKLGKSSTSAIYSQSSQSGGVDRDLKRPEISEFKHHSTLFEHAVVSELEELKESQNTSGQGHKYYHIVEDEEKKLAFPLNSNTEDLGYEITKHEEGIGEDSSWGSNEFDSDSGEDPFPCGNGTLEETSSKVQNEKSFFKRNKELSKDITDGMRKLKFLQRKGTIEKKNTKKEDVSAFVDVRILQDRHSGPHLKLAPTDLLPYQYHRRSIIVTIITSESSYIDSLQRLEINYKKALIETKPAIISSDFVERIFYKVAEILQCHQLFQIALAAAITDWDDHEKIGDTFVASFSKSMVLECYSSYINNFTTAMELSRKICKQRPQYLTFLRERQNESKNRLNLYGLMLKPVQRFPQFIMLVQDLLKHTPTDHHDCLPLQLALTELSTLAENLNQRRAEDEERTEMIRLLESSNLKVVSNLTKDGRTRRLLKQGFVREVTHSEEGTVEKDRECLLVLTNDMLLSCNCTNRRQQAKSSISTFRDLYKLKWCTALDVLSIVDQRDLLFCAEQMRIKSDIATLKSISEMVQKLHHPISGLTMEQFQLYALALEAKIKNPDEGVTDNAFTIQFPQKSGDFRRTLVMPDHQLYNEWFDIVINAKLANDQKNLHCWFSADGSDPEYLWKPPLFLESVNCLEEQHSLQVQCAYAFMPSSHVTLLWLACSASTVVATVNIYRIVDEKVKRVHVMQVESSVQCMEHWSSCQHYPSVWLGMECGSLIEFGTDSNYSKLCEVTMPTMSTVMILKAFEKNLYAGLLDGSLVMYTRPEGHKGLVQVQSLTVGSGPLNCLSPLKGRLWGSSGNDIVTIRLDDFKIESTCTIQVEEAMTISHVVQVGSGFWVAFCDTCSLHLYHLDSLKLLQDLNLSRAIRDFFQGLGWKSRVGEESSITSMWSAYSQLLVGTSNGLILAMPLPKLSGSVPKITGPCRICYHMLNGPVHFLCAPEMPSVTLWEGVSEIEKEKKDVPPEIPERSPTKAVKSPDVTETFGHKRTSSEGLLNVADTSPVTFSTNPMKKRFSGIEPYLNSIRSTGEEIHRLLIPPALPPKPNTLKNTDIATEKMLEDDFLFNNTDVEDIPSANRTMERDGNASKSRNVPVLLACGDGYRYTGNGSSEDELNASLKATTILSWKIVL